MELLRPPISNS